MKKPLILPVVGKNTLSVLQLMGYIKSKSALMIFDRHAHKYKYGKRNFWARRYFVEAAEKSKYSRLARELIVALPIELQLDEWKSILHKFITENYVDKCTCADVNIRDTDGHNPHSHILLKVCPLDDKGKWQAKTQKEYLCKRGDEEQGFTSDEFKVAQVNGWEKQYQIL